MIEDVRDALESQLWYMRLEGGRYRFTTEPNLNKVVLEREAGDTEPELVRAISCYEEARSLVAADSDPRGVAMLHDNLGNAYQRLRDGDPLANLRRRERRDRISRVGFRR